MSWITMTDTHITWENKFNGVKISNENNVCDPCKSEGKKYEGWIKYMEIDSNEVITDCCHCGKRTERTLS